ncbi:MAG: hypothetical protein ACI4VP_00920 [Clostridia bacterium]
MKVLFAVDNDNISEEIVKRYQKQYKEIISYKNVYYFNAILKELQNDKTYDRVVISEDLEPFANNNYDTIDKFLFEKLDKISDEATKASGENIEIILICTDRRSKSDEMLTKIFGIGIYNALLGEERNIDNLCKLMNQPRTKKEAKIAYKIEGTNIGYQAEDENNVSEAEVRNILAHYKRLGKDEDKYVDSFNNIVSQYTDAQLRIIIRYLPMNVKAVLEERSQKYQELATFSARNNRTSGKEPYKSKAVKTTKAEEKIKVEMLNNQKDKITRPIVIPSTLNNKRTVKIENERPVIEQVKEEKVLGQPELANYKEPIKKGRGRPRKNPVQEETIEEQPKRGRGRPKKKPEESEVDLFNISQEENLVADEKEDVEEIDLFNMEPESSASENKEDNTASFNDEEEPDIDLFNMNEDEDSQAKKDDDVDLFSISQEEENNVDLFNINEELTHENRSIQPTSKIRSNLNSLLLTSEKKIVIFVGTTKNGTSFVVNNLALTLASMNISTAILDTTQSKNAYYIYTNNEERLRTIAEHSIDNLEKGIANGIVPSKNLTVYTGMPGEEQKHEDVDSVLVTLMENHDLVLIDADFNTPVEYFEEAQEIYLVQSMDILTIQPLTAFLRNLRSKNVLRQEKIKIVINKEQKVRSLSDKLLIGGMSSYNNPSMSLMTDLFDKNSVEYCKIPFEIQNYVKYLDSLVNCEISLRGYTKQLLASLKELAGMVYPLLNQSKYVPPKGEKRSRMQFSDATNNTLNKMKNNY